MESLSCGTPIIVKYDRRTQEQVTNGKDWFGIGILPSSKSIIGSQDVPYIYEDRIDKAIPFGIVKDLQHSCAETRKMGMMGKKHVEDNYKLSKDSMSHGLI